MCFLGVEGVKCNVLLEMESTYTYTHTHTYVEVYIKQ